MHEFASKLARMNTQSSYSRLRLQHLSNGNVSVSFHIGNTRYRYTNGKVIGEDLYPNRLPENQRESAALNLMFAFKNALDEGWNPDEESKENQTLEQIIEAVKFDDTLTKKYLIDIKKTQSRFIEFLRELDIEKPQDLSKSHCEEYLDLHSSSPSTFNHERKRLSSLIKKSLDRIGLFNPVSNIDKKREKQSMHKPIQDAPALLDEIKSHNENLFLCCLLTYGCLLRPHQEIRQLTWGDFSEDLSTISLSGKRNKSGRNRIVPVPSYITQHLQRGNNADNIFTGNPEPFNRDYFKLQWRRFKSKSELLEEQQTLYSFRHTGAIDIFKRTGSLQKLQQAMGHSSLAVTLSYLRGLDIPQLTQEDMPRL